MLIINSPQNPTGGILTQEDLKQIAELAVQHDLWVLADEIYGRITYDGFKNYTIASYPGMMDRTIILDGFSKTYAMTGWRLGYGIMPKELAEIVAKLQTNVASCTASFMQMAGIEALTGPQTWVDNVVEEFRKRRDLIVDGMNSIPGFKCHKPLGAFYVFPNVKGTGIDSKTLANRILNEAGVACLSGHTFGKYGQGYVRFSYANSMENIEKGIERIRKFMGAIGVGEEVNAGSRCRLTRRITALPCGLGRFCHSRGAKVRIFPPDIWPQKFDALRAVFAFLLASNAFLSSDIGSNTFATIFA